MEELIEKFYQSFQALDYKSMTECYHPDIHFEDPAFGVLVGKDVSLMWEMLCVSQKGKKFNVEYSNIRKDGNKIKAHWEAKYTFSRTGRFVHNKIEAEFEFKDSLIISHKDHFNLHNWSRQATGFFGLLLGSTAYFKRKLNESTRKLLENYKSKQTA